MAYWKNIVTFGNKMHESGKKLLNLMFRPGETVCVSHNKFGYHSIPLEEILNKDTVTLVPTVESCEKRNIEWGPDTFEHKKTDELLLVALNPIKGYREDINATAYRNFLIEIDTGPLAQQLAYAKQLEIPYSAVVFSGNKSLHFLVSLDQDLPSYDVYYHLAEWTLKIVTLADQMTKNPSRSIRIPGAEREPGKRQGLVDYRGPVSLKDFSNWLAKHPEAKPIVEKKRTVSEHFDFKNMRYWVKQRLVNGLDPSKGRNIQWYAIACEFALAGYSYDGTMEILEGYFTPEKDFTRKEWRITIKSAFKNMRARS